MLQNTQHFIEKECILGLCSIERGGALQRLHFQAVFRILSTSTIVVGELVKVYLGWDKGETPSGSHVLVKRLSRVGFHTYVGILGYCIKDKGEDHFEVVHNNITDEDLRAGLEEYENFGTPFAKNKVVLTSKNLLERCLCYLQYRMKSQLRSTLPGVLLHMLCSSTYIPDAQWVIPRTCGGMDYVRAVAMWKCMVSPSTLTIDDVCQKKFLHTNPGTRLRDLGCQQLAADLTAACEGAPHIYNIPLEDDHNSIYDDEMALQTNPKDPGCSSFEPHKLVE